MGAGLLAGLVLSGTACQDGALSRFFRKRPPVVLISIDTLRADRLPAYGYAGRRFCAGLKAGTGLIPVLVTLH